MYVLLLTKGAAQGDRSLALDRLELQAQRRLLPLNTEKPASDGGGRGARAAASDRASSRSTCRRSARRSSSASMLARLSRRSASSSTTVTARRRTRATSDTARSPASLGVRAGAYRRASLPGLRAAAAAAQRAQPFGVAAALAQRRAPGSGSAVFLDRSSACRRLQRRARLVRALRLHSESKAARPRSLLLRGFFRFHRLSRRLSRAVRMQVRHDLCARANTAELSKFPAVLRLRARCERRQGHRARVDDPLRATRCARATRCTPTQTQQAPRQQPRSRRSRRLFRSRHCSPQG